MFPCTLGERPVDVAAFHGDEIIGTIEINPPVVVTIASGRVVRSSIGVNIGEGNTV